MEYESFKEFFCYFQTFAFFFEKKDGKLSVAFVKKSASPLLVFGLASIALNGFMATI